MVVYRDVSGVLLTVAFLKCLSIAFVKMSTDAIRTTTLRKHAHATYSAFHGCKNDNFQLIFFDYFLIFAQNIDCGYK